MKKLLIIAVMVAAAATAQAQTPIGYQGEVDAGCSIGVGRHRSGRINMHTVHGIRLWDVLFVGVGTGIDYYHGGEGDGQLVVPVYANVKSYMPVSGVVQPYLSLDLGSGFGVTRSLQGESGFMCTAAAGIKLSRLAVQAGYNLQQLHRARRNRNFNAVQIKVGVLF